MWLREMAGMELHRIEYIVDGMNLWPTKLKSTTTAQAKSLIETAKCQHAHVNTRLLSLMMPSKPTASNEANWCEAQM